MYVAAVWNTYRTTLLRLYDVIAQASQYLAAQDVPLHATHEYTSLHAMANETCEGICSSVAYHINGDWLKLITTGSFHKSPRALGGLFLIWPLYGGSILSVVPDVLRLWMRQKLRSIGLSMGLAQAVILADTVDLRSTTDPFKPLVIAQGHTFMWSASMF